MHSHRLLLITMGVCLFLSVKDISGRNEFPERLKGRYPKKGKPIPETNIAYELEGSKRNELRASTASNGVSPCSPITANCGETLDVTEPSSREIGVLQRTRRYKARDRQTIPDDQQDWMEGPRDNLSSNYSDHWCSEPNNTSSGMSGNWPENDNICDVELHCPRENCTDNDNTDSLAPEHVRRAFCDEGRFCCCCQASGSSDIVANCSGHNGNLTYIPSVWDNVTFLDFSRNWLTAIDYSFFENITSIQKVNLSNNRLESIDPKAFLRVNFTCLMMGNNFNVDISNLTTSVFSMGSLEELDLSNAYAVKLPENIFQNSPGLKRLYLQSVHLRVWNTNMFQSLEALRVLRLSGNDMRYIHVNCSRTFKSLLILDLEDNDLFHFPPSCENSDDDLFPNLQLLNLARNKIKQLPTNVRFPSLRKLIIQHNPVVKLSNNTFSSGNYPNLTCLFMEHLELRYIQHFAFNNTSLRFLSFMYNYVDFVVEHVNETSFQGLPNLGFLQLEQNYLNNERFVQLFGHLTTLEHLFIGNTYFDEINTDTFANFPNLKNLTLHRNSFWEIPEGVFDGLQRLTHLDLSNCRITTINENTFSRGLRFRLRHLDLSGNYFRCDCDLLWFRTLLRSDKPIFSRSWTRYQCRNFRNTDVVKFQMNEQVCLLSREAIVITMVVMVLLMMKLTLIAVFFRYRWHIRLLLYEVFRGTGHNRPRRDFHFRYDLFVSYAEEDVNWLRCHLIPELEGRQGVRLCVHQRDFTPGQNIVDNIYQSVQDSRKVLMVFSRHFAHSQWCQFELAMCLSHVIDNGDALLVACVDDVTCGTELTPTMMAVLNTTTYIQWAEEDDAKASFWARMKIVLNDAVP